MISLKYDERSISLSSDRRCEETNTTFHIMSNIRGRYLCEMTLLTNRYTTRATFQVCRLVTIYESILPSIGITLKGTEYHRKRDS